MNRTFTVKEFAQMMRVHPNTVRIWIKKGLPALRLGTFTRIDEEAAVEWLKRPAKKTE